MTAAPEVGATTGTPVDVPAVLARCRDQVDPAMRAALARLDPTSAARSRYHLGLADAHGAPSRGEGRKALRPAITLLAARACGVDAEVAVPGAVAVELVHNFSLVHDDLIDGDTERRHRPTVWSLWGPASAVLTGDAMLALATEVLLETGAARAALLLTTTVRELVGGQVADVAFVDRDDVDVAECLAMAHGKTGTLLGAAAGTGATLADAPPAHRMALQDFGAQLGVAFQLVDDLLGIWGDPAVTGKPVLSDLRERKKSLPVTWAVTHGGGPGRELAAFLATPDSGDEPTLRRAAACVEAGGGRAWAAAEARRRLLAAEASLATLPDSPARAELVALGRHLAHREA